MSRMMPSMIFSVGVVCLFCLPCFPQELTTLSPERQTALLQTIGKEQVIPEQTIQRHSGRETLYVWAKKGDTVRKLTEKLGYDTEEGVCTNTLGMNPIITRHSVGCDDPLPFNVRVALPGPGFVTRVDTAPKQVTKRTGSRSSVSFRRKLQIAEAGDGARREVVVDQIHGFGVKFRQYGYGLDDIIDPSSDQRSQPLNAEPDLGRINLAALAGYTSYGVCILIGLMFVSTIPLRKVSASVRETLERLFTILASRFQRVFEGTFLGEEYTPQSVTLADGQHVHGIPKVVADEFNCMVVGLAALEDRLRQITTAMNIYRPGQKIPFPLSAEWRDKGCADDIQLTYVRSTIGEDGIVIHWVKVPCCEGDVRLDNVGPLHLGQTRLKDKHIKFFKKRSK